MEGLLDNMLFYLQFRVDLFSIHEIQLVLYF